MNGQIKDALTEFKQSLIDMGYKEYECANNDLEVFKKT